jgi:hypothetical protein
MVLYLVLNCIAKSISRNTKVQILLLTMVLSNPWVSIIPLQTQSGLVPSQIIPCPIFFLIVSSFIPPKSRSSSIYETQLMPRNIRLERQIFKGEFQFAHKRVVPDHGLEGITMREKMWNVIYSVKTTYGINSVMSKLMTFLENVKPVNFYFS